MIFCYLIFTSDVMSFKDIILTTYQYFTLTFPSIFPPFLFHFFKFLNNTICNVLYNHKFVTPLIQCLTRKIIERPLFHRNIAKGYKQ